MHAMQCCKKSLKKLKDFFVMGMLQKSASNGVVTKKIGGKSYERAI